jgi:hypothetical protein
VTNPPTPTRTLRARWIVLAVVVLPLAVVIGIQLAGGDDREGPTRSGAETVCRQFVEDDLKAPASAEWGSTSASQLTGTSWEVLGEVDAQNSFGAQVRTRFTCRAKWESGTRWTLLHLSTR